MAKPPFSFVEVLRECTKFGTDKVVTELKKFDANYVELETQRDEVSGASDVEMVEAMSDANILELSDSSSELSFDCDSSDHSEIEVESRKSKAEMSSSSVVESRPPPVIRRTQISMDVASMSHLSNAHSNDARFLRSEVEDAFDPTPFQCAVLGHMAYVRALIGEAQPSACRRGLIVMATGMGKTVVAILDVECQLHAIHREYGFRFGVRARRGHCAKARKKGQRHIYSMFSEKKSDSTAVDCVDSSESLAASSTKKRKSEIAEIRVRYLDEVCKCRCAVHQPSDEGCEQLDATPIKCRLKQRKSVRKPKRECKLFDAMDTSNESADSSEELEIVDLTPFRLLFIVHTRAICDGALGKFARHLTAVFPNDLSADDFVAVETDTSDDAILHGTFLFCLFQSLETRLRPLVESRRLRVTHLIIDETHHLLADTWLSVYRSLFSDVSYVLGMTATLSHRSDACGKRLRKLFGGVMYCDLPWTDAKRLGFFPEVDFCEVLPTFDMKTYSALLQTCFVGKRIGEAKPSALRHFLYSVERSLKCVDKRPLSARTVVDFFHFFEQCTVESGHLPKRKVVIFAANATDACEMQRLLQAAGQSCAAVHYKKSAEFCRKALDAFSNGPLRILINVNLINEGFDVPSVDCVILARRTQSEIVFVQQIGRALRKGAKTVTVLDLTLNLRRRWVHSPLRHTVTDQHLCKLIESFWHVSTLVFDSALLH